MSQTVRIPADVDREDTVLGNLTARQLAILATTGAVLYSTWSVTRAVVPLPLFLAAALPIGAAAALLALGQRDGISLDRLMLAALRQHTSPRHQVTAPEGIHPPPAWLTSRIGTNPGSTGAVSAAELRFPAREISQAGVVDLSADGLAVVAVCGTVNFALRTPAEQHALIGGFGQYLHSLSAPVQILVRAERLDLSAPISELRHRAPSLPHPALEAAAHEHADYLTGLAGHSDLLRRQVLLILREPLRVAAAPCGSAATAPPFAGRLRRRGSRRGADAAESARRAAEARLVRRLNEAEELLRPLGVTVTALDAGQTTGVLAATCNPGSLIPPSPALAGAQDVITSQVVEDGNASEWTGPS